MFSRFFFVEFMFPRWNTVAILFVFN